MPAGVIGSLTSDVLEAFPVWTAPVDFGHALAQLAAPQIVSPPTSTTGER